MCVQLSENKISGNISVGRNDLCFLEWLYEGVVERSFVKTPFYRSSGSISLEGENFDGEWRAVEGRPGIFGLSIL